MNGLGAISFGVGLQDGLNPCVFMTCAVYIAYDLWLRQRSLPVFWFRILFLLVYLAGILFFNFGPAQIITFHKSFILTAKIIYFILGFAALLLGILFFWDWIKISRHLPALYQADQKVKTFKAAVFVTFLLTIMLPVVLSAMATLWPINTYFLILGNESLVKGQWHAVISLLAIYVLSSMWSLWLMWVFVSIKKIRPSTFRIICAAFFFTAATNMILLFK